MTRASVKPIVTLVSLLQLLYHSFPLIRTNFEMPESLTIGIGGRGGVPVLRLVGVPISNARRDRVGPNKLLCWKRVIEGPEINASMRAT